MKTVSGTVFISNAHFFAEPLQSRPDMTSVRLNHITKQFGSTTALDNIDLEIAAGELFFLLGPSGCGKSTLLRLIAGLHDPTSGRIFFNDCDVTRLGTDKRHAVMCFQSYALWPHMTVRDNVGFGLDVRKVTPSERMQRIDEVLALVQMTAMADRKPNQLSGGQQQRVALARALAVKPDCLLLDEPLSNLDAQLRLEMRTEIRRICKTAGFTTIYVTHDQKEALSVADRIAVLKDGKLAQVGTPGELYHAPTSSFVASFIGQTNLLPGKVTSRGDGSVNVDTAAGAIVATLNGSPVPDNVIVSIRPEQMRVVRNGSPVIVNHLVGKVIETTFLGEASEHVVAVNEQKLKVICTPPMFQPPEDLTLEFDPKDALVLGS
jgi:iron(III) transport system ATP-binding protein